MERGRTYLRDGLEQGTAHTLFVRQADFGHEERAGRKDEVGSEHAHDRRGEAESPVRRVRVDDGEEQVGDACQEGAYHYI